MTEPDGGASDASGPLCPSCHSPIAGDDRWCEACGTELPALIAESPAAPPAEGACSSCRGTVGEDGYCAVCGLKQPDPHDHEEIDLEWAAGVTDRGLHHARNEDAMAVETLRTGLAVAVVCDGVSSSSNAEAAAAAAVAAATPVLRDGAGGDPKATLVEAAAAAQRAVVAVPKIDDGVAPSCTLVAAILHDQTLTVGWLGDSRAYWLCRDGNERLTTDDSWAAEQVATGTLTEEQAEADAQAHGITRWLGADAVDTVPRTVHLELSAPGCLVVCSDGLWNYASSADQIAGLLADLPPVATPIESARHLTNFARDAGGHDNITVVVLQTQENA